MFVDIVKESFSINEICLKVYGYNNGRVREEILKIIKDQNLDISHFDKGKKSRIYEIVEKDCLFCDKKFKTKKGHKKETKCCSRECNNKLNSSKHREETKIKIKNSVNKYISENPRKNGVSNKNKKTSKERNNTILKVCPECNVEYLGRKSSKYCSIKCSINFKVKNRLFTGWQSRNIESYPEKFFKKVLENNNIEYVFNKALSKRTLGIECDANYFLDFYLVDKNIDLEIDGKQHDTEERKEHDEYRDYYLTKNGYIVYRIKWKNITSNGGKEYIKNEIEKFIDFYNKN
jgi:very-short-patch-repair endonuclease